jgi:hypothetical protein
MPTIEDVLLAKKTVLFPARPKVKSPSTQRDVDLELDCQLPDLKARIVLYIRVNTLFTELFSIGLRLEMKGAAPSLIVRLNGGHGPHKNPDGTMIAMGQPHIHVPTPQELVSDFKSKVKLVKAEPVPCGDPASAWPFFESWARITPDRRMTTLVTAMCDAGKQMEFEEALRG